MSDITKTYRTKALIFTVLSFLFTFLPIIIFTLKGLFDGSIDLENKLKLGVALASALLLTVLGIKTKYNCRSIVYILLFGCYFVIKDIKFVILVCGLCCIADEFCISPAAKHYRSKYGINKEIDKRVN